MNADVPLPFKTPVNVVAPVPPLPTIRVPARLTAPVVALLGVRPVLPPLNEATVLEVVANVPLVGNVTDVVPVTVNVVPNDPVIVRVLATLLATPVPPLVAASTPVELAPSAKMDRLREIVMTYYSRLASIRL